MILCHWASALQKLKKLSSTSINKCRCQEWKKLCFLQIFILRLVDIYKSLSCDGNIPMLGALCISVACRFSGVWQEELTSHPFLGAVALSLSAGGNLIPTGWLKLAKQCKKLLGLGRQHMTRWTYQGSMVTVDSCLYEVKLKNRSWKISNGSNQWFKV